ncbi:hypothetical protein VTK26DRAFT_4145 [Humicola hyalothermophila]
MAVFLLASAVVKRAVRMTSRSCEECCAALDRFEWGCRSAHSGSKVRWMRLSGPAGHSAYTTLVYQGTGPARLRWTANQSPEVPESADEPLRWLRLPSIPDPWEIGIGIPMVISTLQGTCGRPGN